VEEKTNEMAGSTFSLLSVKRNKQPIKILNSASFTQVINPPELMRSPPEEGVIPWVDFGLLHYYRSMFFDNGLVTGSIEQVLSIAPHETIELGIEVSRRTTLEEENEVKLQTTNSNETSSSLTSEFTDRVSSVIQTTNSSSASMNVSGGVGIFTAGATGNVEYTSSRTDSTEKMKKTVNEATQRVSQEIMKSQVFRTRRTEEVTSKDYYRRLIVNNTDNLNHYGLRRLQQSYTVRTQFLGPRLVWQFSVYDPGKRIATPRIITESIIPSPLLQAGARDIRYTIFESHTVSIDGTLPNPSVAWIRPLYLSYELRIIDMVFENGETVAIINRSGQNNGKPWSYSGAMRLIGYKPVANSPGSYEASFQMARISATGAVPNQIEITFPRVQVLMLDTEMEVIWRNNPNTVSEFLPKYRQLLADTRSIKPRPAGDLRREERDEVVSRAFEMLNLRDTIFSPKDVLDMTNFFDIESTFYQLTPPFVQSSTSHFGGGNAWAREYDIVAEADPAPMGSSIGWRIQTDGDTRRNEFINSSLARVCIPIQKTKEKEATDFLKARLGAVVPPKVEDLIVALKKRWALEATASINNKKESDVPMEDKITDSFPEQADPIDNLALALYPVVDIFDTAEPTQGFVYTPLRLP